MGGLTTLGSHCHFRNPVHAEAIAINLIDIASSLCYGIMIFNCLGIYLIHKYYNIFIPQFSRCFKLWSKYSNGRSYGMARHATFCKNPTFFKVLTRNSPSVGCTILFQYLYNRLVVFNTRVFRILDSKLILWILFNLVFY